MAEEQFFTSAISLALPWLQKLALNITFPPQKTSKSSIDAIHIDGFSLGGASFTMTSPNQLNLLLQNLSITVRETPFSVNTLLSECEGMIWAFVDATNATLSVNVSRLSNGTLRLKTAAITIEWSTVEVGHIFFSPLCKLLGEGTFVTSIISKKVKKALNEMPYKMGTLIEEKANDFFDSFFVTLVEDPDITEDRAILAMNTIYNSKVQKVPSSVVDPIFYPSSTPVVPQRNLAAVFTGLALNDLLIWLSRGGWLNRSIQLPSEYNSSLVEQVYPDVYKLCSDCPFVFSIHPTVPPSVFLQSGQTVILQVLNGFLGLAMTSPSGDSIAVLDTLVNLTGGVTGVGITSEAYLHLSLTEVDLAIEVVQTRIAPLDATVLSQALRRMLNEFLIPMLNAKFRRISLPSYIMRPVANISTEFITVGFDVGQ
ncbi:ESAG-like protein [Trypanosoma rangeli]|uniref:ESAG-like protein n=1 Tax=Trypanosoma rangeli TaxID=5698 RepID=A0A3R7MV71_TRYRA|nr:ESAG-like protein [Trypanosoma rangeli]RNF08567.1 ESAG-like protein [Trypanosoma rangeli]|eukprot:RNF08567.1 ESAG-like protein [Trypanosoma rangeli]